MISKLDKINVNTEKVLATARKVFQLNEKAIARLSEELPVDFVSAVSLLYETRGRVIVSGIGKSGHIGRKISATLVSTGTPSHFVHATEASHGDLGMITVDDVVMLISNSGETKELVDILAYARRFDIPVVAITSRPESTLATASNYLLCLPDVPETCPMGMAPTTSSLLTLALGDALAVALIELRGFESTQFKVFHPGGKLGAQLATVSQLMHSASQLPLVGLEMHMSEVLIEMTSKGFGVAGVMNADTLVGIVSDGDLRRNMATLMESTARSVATMSPVCAHPGMMAAEALALMNECNISVLFVVDDEQIPIGILHVQDLLRAGVV